MRFVLSVPFLEDMLLGECQ